MNDLMPLHLLYVDDNPGDLDLAREALDESGLRTCFYAATDGEDALDFLHGRGRHPGTPRPHVIMLDLNMPRKNGIDTLREIKADAKFQSIPVVIFTSSTAPSDLHQAYGSYANAYVPKPSGLEDFLWVVQQIELFWSRVARITQRK